MKLLARAASQKDSFVVDLGIQKLWCPCAFALVPLCFCFGALCVCFGAPMLLLWCPMLLLWCPLLWCALVPFALVSYIFYAFAFIPFALVPCAFALVTCTFAAVPFAQLQLYIFLIKIPLATGKMLRPIEGKVQGLFMLTSEKNVGAIILPLFVVL